MKKIFLIISVYLFLLALNANAQIYQNWKWLHQSPQGNELRWVKMWNVNTIYAMGGKGTFVKTTDRGFTWTVTNLAGRLGGIPLQRSDVRDAWFFDQNTGIAVGTLGSISRTTNGGITFDTVPGNPIPTNANVTGVSFINNLTGYAITGQTNYRLMKTTDGGLHWFTAPGSPGYSNPYGVHAFNENKILVANQQGDVFITTNGGLVWNTYNTGTLVNIYKPVFIDANTGFVCGDWGRCKYTNDGGFTWQNMAGTMLSQDYHYFNLKYRNGTVFLTGNSKYIWKSSNFGVTWDSISFIAPPAQVEWSNSYYASDFSFTGDTMVTVGAKGSIHQSLGTNKLTHSQYLKTGSIRDIWLSSSDGIAIAVGALSASTLSTPDQILRSTNGGLNWTKLSPSPSSNADFYCIEMLDNNTGFICGSRSAVYKTTNTGLNWDSIIIPNMPANLVISKVDFVNSQTGWLFTRYVTGNDSTIFKTTNGGVNWFKQKLASTTGTASSIYTSAMLDENSGWVINNRPRPWKTTNGGQTWDSTSLSDNYSAGLFYDIKMFDMNTGYCCGSMNRIYKTTNGGATPWQNVSFSSTTVITNYTLEFATPLEGVVMGTYGTAYYTSNGGAGWINSSLFCSIDDIYGSFLTADRKLYGTTLTNAGVFKNSNVFPVGITGYNEIIPEAYNLEQNYPNPFNLVTSIKFKVASSSQYPLKRGTLVSLKVFDLLGREVATLVNEFLKPGVYSINFDAGNLTSGIYFYRLSVNDFSETRKFVLLK